MPANNPQPITGRWEPISMDAPVPVTPLDRQAVLVRRIRDAERRLDAITRERQALRDEESRLLLQLETWEVALGAVLADREDEQPDPEED